MKEMFLERFNKIYPDCQLYCIQLNGFSHTVFYKDKDGNQKVEGYSAYAPEQYDDFSDGKHGWNRDQAKMLFAGTGHNCYQHNAKEIIYKDVKGW